MAKRQRNSRAKTSNVKRSLPPGWSLTSLPEVIISQILLHADQKPEPDGPEFDQRMNQATPRRPNNDMLALSATCSSIRAMARRLVWYNVWVPLTVEGLEMATFLEQADQETRRLVRTISLGPSGPQDRASHSPGDHDATLTRLLPLLPNLRAIHSALTTDTLLDVIKTLPLETLSLMVLKRPVVPHPGLRRLDFVFGRSISDEDVAVLHGILLANASTLEHLDIGVVTREGQGAQSTLQDIFFPPATEPRISLPRLGTLYIRGPNLESSFFTHLATAAPNLHTLNVPMDDIDDPVRLDVPPGSFPNLARLEIGVPPRPDGSSTGVERLIKGNKHLELLTLHLSATDSLAVVEAAAESPGVHQLVITKTSTALLRQIGLSLPNLVNLDFEDIVPATSGTEGERDFEYSDLPNLLAPVTRLRRLVISAQRVISPIRSFERLLADPTRPRTEAEINDVFDALDERDMPAMLPTVLDLFRRHAECETIHFVAYGTSRLWSKQAKRISSDVVMPAPDASCEDGWKVRHRVQTQSEAQWKKRLGAMEQRWIERSLKEESESEDDVFGGNPFFQILMG